MSTFFNYKYEATTVILAPANKVWEVLIDLAQYKKWNPFTPAIETSWAPGSKVVMQVAMWPGKKPIRQTEYLAAFQPEELIAWGMHWPPVLRAMRTQRIEVISDRETRYSTSDVIGGPLSPLVHLIYGKAVQEGFDKMVISLKKYIENP